MKRPAQRRNSKLESLRRLEQSALALFSSRGYDGTSLRDIAEDAGVQLSLIDRYFGNKLHLFQEIHLRIWRSINQERLELLAKARRTEAGSIALDEIVRAFAKPVVCLALSSPNGQAAIRLIREGRVFLVHRHLDGSERNAIRQPFIDALIAARPRLSRSHAVWGLSFLIDTVYSRQLLDDWLNDLMLDAQCLSVDEVTEVIVTFCSAGLDALAQRAPSGDAKTV